MVDSEERLSVFSSSMLSAMLQLVSVVSPKPRRFSDAGCPASLMGGALFFVGRPGQAARQKGPAKRLLWQRVETASQSAIRAWRAAASLSDAL
jgi:hypothetical protein